MIQRTNLPAPGQSTLSVRVGHASELGRREANEDFFGAVTPEGAVLSAKGALFAVADGVSGTHGGREAAEFTVRSLLGDYYATPDTWEVPLSLDRVLTAANRWVLAQSTVRREFAGMATTLSALVLRGSRFHIAHVGDSRIYRLRRDKCVQLTTDHVWDRADMQHVLKRAVGLDQHLAVDYSDGELEAGDVFLICSDGVWEPVGQVRLHALLALHKDPTLAAKALVDAAFRDGGQDNATAQVIMIDAVSPDVWLNMLDDAHALPVPPRLRPGTQIDDFEVLDRIHESRATLLYKVRSRSSGQVYALKTLQPALEGDRQSSEGLLCEEWLAKRLVSKYFPQVLPLAPGARQWLYYVMSHHQGSTLQAQLDRGRHFAAPEVVNIGVRLLRGIGVMHRLAVLHRDVKPANLLAEDNGGLRILDMGVALAAGVPYPELQGNPGTPSFMAPELFHGGAASAQSDLYATGVTLYHLLTRKYPYGEVEPFQVPRFGEPMAPTRYRPDVPHWLENVLLRACARDPRQRFETAEEMLLALERGETNMVAAPRRTPLLHSRVLRWQSLALISLVINLLLIYLLFMR
ncbi:MAG: bifunctional protein-serine/threonine kinase/phosphatase [Burkholderiales bacterium]